MFKTDLPPDSSWKWDVKVYEDPLPTGRYVLADDYKKLEAMLEKVTKERDQAVELMSMRYENLNRDGKTILDFQAVWIRQARDGIQKLQARDSELEKKLVELENKLVECEKFKQGYYDEAAKAWAKLNEEDKKIKQAYTKKE